MREFALRNRVTLIVVSVTAVALLVWSALGGQPFALLKYKAEVVKERAASTVTARSGRLHPATTAKTASSIGSTGRPQLVDFYAEWCPNCRALSPGLKKLEAKYRGKVDIIHIDIDSSPGQALLGDFRVNAIPTLYLLDKKGKTIDVIVGGTAPEILDRKLSEL